MKRGKINVIGMFFLFLVVRTGSADTIHVDICADCRGDGSPSKPFCNLATAIAAATPDDNIIMQSGFYPENLVINKQLAITASEGPVVIGKLGSGDRHRPAMRVVGTPYSTMPYLVRLSIELNVPGSPNPLDELKLIFDDTSIPDGDTPLVLFSNGASSFPSLELARQPNGGFTRYALEFDLPLWQVGQNNLKVLANLQSNQFPFQSIPRMCTTIPFTFELPSPNWGIGQAPCPGNRLGTSFSLSRIPIWADMCPFILCKDADQDGLLDLWENIAIEVLNPILEHDENEDLFSHPNDQVKNFCRVTPIGEGFYQYIQFLYRVSYTRDYGPGGHNGDKGSFQILWRAIDSYEIWLDEVWTRGHEGLFRRNTTTMATFDRVELTNEGLVKIYAEEDKHSTWYSGKLCGVYDCGCDVADGSEEGNQKYCLIRPSVFNVGEPPSLSDNEKLAGDKSGRPFIDELDLHPALYGVFAGEAVWNDNKFCGGLRCDDGSPGSIGSDLRGGNVRGKVSEDKNPRLVEVKERSVFETGAVRATPARQDFIQLWIRGISVNRILQPEVLVKVTLGDESRLLPLYSAYSEPDWIVRFSTPPDRIVNLSIGIRIRNISKPQEIMDQLNLQYDRETGEITGSLKGCKSRMVAWGWGLLQAIYFVIN